MSLPRIFFPSGRLCGQRADGTRHPRFFIAIAASTLLTLFCLLLSGPALASASVASKGRASWYGVTAHGKKTANGEIYNREALTAAHKSAPFGTVLRVFNLKNGKEVLVRVNDRGPFVEGREVDLSLRAAEALRMLRSGVVSVAIQVVSDKKGRPLNRENAFYVHLANDENFLGSRILAADMTQRVGVPVRSMRLERGAYKGYALLAGPYERFRDAQKAFMRLEKKDIAVLGVVEGPINGNALPVSEIPGRRKSGREQGQTPENSPLGQALAELSASGLNLEADTSALFLSIAKNILPGLAGGALLLSPSASLSACLNSL